jgi:hypothetical protein
MVTRWLLKSLSRPAVATPPVTQHPGAVNQRLIDAVFAELADLEPGGFSYRVARSEDGPSFEHVAVLDGGLNPLLGLSSFQAFSSSIGERVLAPPAVQTGAVVVRYR